MVADPSSLRSPGMTKRASRWKRSAPAVPYAMIVTDLEIRASGAICLTPYASDIHAYQLLELLLAAADCEGFAGFRSNPSKILKSQLPSLKILSVA